MARLLVAIAFSVTLSLSAGCEFWSEINAEMNRGQAELDKYVGNGNKIVDQGGRGAGAGRAEPAAPAADPSSPGATERARRAASGWWQKARTLATDEKDPSIIRCDLGGGVQFMREAECRARGGRVERG